MIAEVWVRPCNQVEGAARRLSRKLKWARAESKKCAGARLRPSDVVANCRAVISLLDLLEEFRILTTAEARLRGHVRKHLSSECKKLDAYWKQGYTSRLCKLGDENTSFFHASASARLRRNQIVSL